MKFLKKVIDKAVRMAMRLFWRMKHKNRTTGWETGGVGIKRRKYRSYKDYVEYQSSKYELVKRMAPHSSADYR
jgi:hypothetical protein